MKTTSDRAKGSSSDPREGNMFCLGAYAIPTALAPYRYGGGGRESLGLRLGHFLALCLHLPFCFMSWASPWLVCSCLFPHLECRNNFTSQDYPEGEVNWNMLALCFLPGVKYSWPCLWASNPSLDVNKPMIQWARVNLKGAKVYFASISETVHACLPHCFGPFGKWYGCEECTPVQSCTPHSGRNREREKGMGQEDRPGLTGAPSKPLLSNRSHSLTVHYPSSSLFYESLNGEVYC